MPPTDSLHLVDLFKQIPNKNSIEVQKREFLDRVFHDIINKIGKKNIDINEYSIKTNKGKQPLNLP